jgi:hypothetical protein
VDSKHKENIQYTTAIVFLFSGIVMCFLSFFMNEYDVGNGALTYLGEATAFCAGVFSINLYVRKKISEAEMRINSRMDKKMHQVDESITDNENP